MLYIHGKKIFLRLFLPLFLSIGLSLSVFAGGQQISGEIKGGEDGVIILYEFYGSQAIPKDSAEINSGQFRFTYKKPLPRGFYSIGKNPKDARVFVLSGESIELIAEKGAIRQAEIKGSKELDIFRSYQKVVNEANRGIQDINKRVSIARDYQNTDPETYRKELDKIRSDYDTLVNWQHAQYRKIAQENKGTFVGKICDYFARSEGETADTYMDLEALKDRELLRGDMFKTKYLMYFQQYLGANTQILKVKSEEMTEVELPAEAKEIVYAGIIEAFAQADANFAGKIAKKFIGEFPESDIARVYFSSLPQGPPEIGDQAPDIKMQNPDGEIVSLSSLKGQIVLLDFWASWCGPCRRENPNVVRTYKDYKDSGFTVFSVSLDNNRDKWLAAIEKDSLVWENHVSDLKGWSSSGAALYGVRSIPATFLLDENGVIIAKNLRGSILESKLEEILGAN